MKVSRIPDFVNKSKQGMSTWFNEMQLRGLEYDPLNPSDSIIKFGTRKRLFTPTECRKLDGIIAEMFERFGQNEVCDISYLVYMKTVRLN